MMAFSSFVLLGCLSILLYNHHCRASTTERGRDVHHYNRIIYIDGRTGQPLNISCFPSGSLEGPSLTETSQWTFQRQLLSENENIRFLNNNRILHIQSVRMLDEGYYECTVSSTNGASRSHATHLSVCQSSSYNGPPTEVSVSQETICIEKGRSTSVSCEGMVGVQGCGDSAWISWWFYNANNQVSTIPEGVVQGRQSIDEKEWCNKKFDKLWQSDRRPIWHLQMQGC